MLKTSVIEHFKTPTKAAIALGVHKSTISNMPERVPWQYALLVEKITNNQVCIDFSMYKDTKQFASLIPQK